MSADLPANRVHLVLAGLPQRNAEPLALNICAALQFAANTFPEFQAFVQTDLGADGFPEGFRSALADLTPEFLAQIADMVTAGVAADKQASEIPDAATHSFGGQEVHPCTSFWVGEDATLHCCLAAGHNGEHLAREADVEWDSE